jgi:hypothetical protein
LHWICNFKNGMLNGEALQYDRYGNHLLTLQYKDNKLHGECIDHVTNTSCEYYIWTLTYQDVWQFQIPQLGCSLH